MTDQTRKPTAPVVRLVRAPRRTGILGVIRRRFAWIHDCSGCIPLESPGSTAAPTDTSATAATRRRRFGTCSCRTAKPGHSTRSTDAPDFNEKLSELRFIFGVALKEAPLATAVVPLVPGRTCPQVWQALAKHVRSSESLTLHTDKMKQQRSRTFCAYCARFSRDLSNSLLRFNHVMDPRAAAGELEEAARKAVPWHARLGFRRCSILLPATLPNWSTRTCDSRGTSDAPRGGERRRPHRATSSGGTGQATHGRHHASSNQLGVLFFSRSRDIRLIGSFELSSNSKSLSNGTRRASEQRAPATTIASANGSGTQRAYACAGKMKEQLTKRNNCKLASISFLLSAAGMI